MTVELRRRPPIGVLPVWLWMEQNPEPSAEERADRIETVEDAIRRYEAAGFVPPSPWRDEVIGLLYTVGANP